MEMKMKSHVVFVRICLISFAFSWLLSFFFFSSLLWCCGVPYCMEYRTGITKPVCSAVVGFQCWAFYVGAAGWFVS